MLEAAFVRSPHAHAAIRGIDASAARRCAGVHAVLTFSDLAPLLAQERLPLQFRTARLPGDITPLVLAKDEVAFVGEAVAVVIAQTRYIGAVAAYDVNEDRLTLWSSTQLAHEVRAFLMTMLRLDENQLRVVAPDVGGG